LSVLSVVRHAHTQKVQKNLTMTTDVVRWQRQRKSIHSNVCLYVFLYAVTTFKKFADLQVVTCSLLIS